MVKMARYVFAREKPSPLFVDLLKNFNHIWFREYRLLIFTCSIPFERLMFFHDEPWLLFEA